MAIQTVADMMSGFAGATVAEIGYGHRIESFDDESFKLGEKSGKIVGEGATPILLDVHPICEYPEVGLRAGVSNCKADEFVQHFCARAHNAIECPLSATCDFE